MNRQDAKSAKEGKENEDAGHKEAQKTQNF